MLGVMKEENPNKEFVKTFDPDKLGPKKILFTWSAPSRVETKGNEKISRTLMVIGIFIGLLLVIMQEYALILLIASLVFVNHAIKKVSPEKVTHEISTHGFSYAGQLYYWHQLKNFFFLKDNMLAIDTYDTFPGRLFAIVSIKDHKEITNALEKYIHFLEQVPQTSLDKIYDSVVDKLKL